MKQYLDESKWTSHLNDPMYLFRCGRIPLIYKLIDTNDKNKIVYIGETINGARRMSSHNRDNGYIFDNILFIEVPEKERKDIEKYLINHYTPKYNTIHNKNVKVKNNNRGKHLSKETKEKISKAMMGNKNFNINKSGVKEKHRQAMLKYWEQKKSKIK